MEIGIIVVCHEQSNGEEGKRGNGEKGKREAGKRERGKEGKRVRSAAPSSPLSPLPEASY
jgi:hypothetical protein